MFWITNSSALVCIHFLFVGGSSYIPKWDLRIHIKFNELDLNPIPIEVINKFTISETQDIPTMPKYAQKEAECISQETFSVLLMLLEVITWVSTEKKSLMPHYQTPSLRLKIP